MSLGRYGLWKCGPKNDIHVSMIVIDIIVSCSSLRIYLLGRDMEFGKLTHQGVKTSNCPKICVNIIIWAVF